MNVGSVNGAGNVYQPQYTNYNQAVTYSPGMTNYYGNDTFRPTMQQNSGGLFGNQPKTQYVTRKDVMTGLLGAGVGFLIGGPIGALVGGLIGLFLGPVTKLFTGLFSKRQNQVPPQMMQQQYYYNQQAYPNQYPQNMTYPNTNNDGFSQYYQQQLRNQMYTFQK
jgi:hypothetical protein